MSFNFNKPFSQLIFWLVHHTESLLCLTGFLNWARVAIKISNTSDSPALKCLKKWTRFIQTYYSNVHCVLPTLTLKLFLTITQSTLGPQRTWVFCYFERYKKHLWESLALLLWWKHRTEQNVCFEKVFYFQKSSILTLQPIQPFCRLIST